MRFHRLEARISPHSRLIFQNVETSFFIAFQRESFHKKISFGNFWKKTNTFIGFSLSTCCLIEIGTSSSLGKIFADSKMNFTAFGSFPLGHHQFSTAVTSSSVPSTQVQIFQHEIKSFRNRNSFQENRYTTYQTSAPTSSAQVKFRAEDMASTQNKYVTHYPTASSTHLQYYNTPSNQQQPENSKSSYVQASTAQSSVTTSSELSQDITSLLLKEQGGADSTKRVLQSSSVADYLSHLPTSLSLHHFLKYSADAAIKKESVVVVSLIQSGRFCFHKRYSS